MIDTKILKILIDLAEVGNQESPWAWVKDFMWKSEECTLAIETARNELLDLR